MLELKYDYESCVKNSEKVSWTVNEVMPADAILDFSKSFLPSALSGGAPPAFLDERATLLLNQIMGYGYINLFIFVEEYIVAQVLEHAQAELFGDHQALRALSRFADEELKHQQLFDRCLQAVARGFGVPFWALDNAAEVAGSILEKSPIAVMLTTYHLEIMTQAHYVECVKNDMSVEPRFVSLLHHHWLEEAHHARIDALELRKMLTSTTPQQIEEAFAEYLSIIDTFDSLLLQQAEYDAANLALVRQQAITDVETKSLIEHQHNAYRRTFLVYGMTHPSFVNSLNQISPSNAQKVAHKAASLVWRSA
jgi:hypothetical protein